MKSPKKDVSMTLEELSKEIFIAREECLSPRSQHGMLLNSQSWTIYLGQFFPGSLALGWTLLS